MIVIYNVNGLETKGYYVKFVVASAAQVLFATGRFLLHSKQIPLRIFARNPESERSS